jgi:hypothetical protein
MKDVSFVWRCAIFFLFCSSRERQLDREEEVKGMRRESWGMLGCACDAKEAESVGSSTGLGIHVSWGSDIRESFGLEKTLVTSICETFLLSGFETFVPRCVTSHCAWVPVCLYCYRSRELRCVLSLFIFDISAGNRQYTICTVKDSINIFKSLNVNITYFKMPYFCSVDYLQKSLVTVRPPKVGLPFYTSVYPPSLLLLLPQESEIHTNP